jgi:hypothetical protein
MRDIEKGEAAAAEEGADRRQALRRMGRFAAVTAPSVMLLLAAGSKPSQAQSKVSLPVHPPVSSRQFKISEGAVDSFHALAVAMSGLAAADTIDGVGLCLAAVKGVAQKIDALELRLAIL